MHPNDPSLKNCAIYARSAREDASEIDRQVGACGLRASELGAEVQFLYVDNGVPGTGITENLRDLLAAARIGSFDYVIVEDAAWLSQSTALRLFVQADLSTVGVKIEMVFEPALPGEPNITNRGF